MASTLEQILASCERLWPAAGAEAWDAPGLVTGSVSSTVSRVLLSVDVTAAVVAEAIELNCQLLISHHPFIMRGVSTVSEQTAKGATLSQAIRANLAIFAAHTNADIVADGVSDTIAKALGLADVRALDNPGNKIGHGRVGELPAPIPLGEFARLVAKVFPSTAGGIRVAGDYNQSVSKIALCGGAGDSFIANAFACSADVYLTSDLRHHLAQDARESALLDGGPALVDVSHWASEWLWLETAAQQLRKIYPDIDFIVCDLRTDPWDFVITQ